MTPSLLRAYETDHGVFIRNALIKDRLREKHRWAVIAEEEMGLPDYERPLKEIRGKMKWPSIIKFAKLFIP